MKERRALDDYLSSIERELFGLDPKARKAALEEVRSHLIEEAKEAASDKGMAQPNDATFRDVIKNFGNPFDVAYEYRKNMDIKTPKSIKMVLFYCLFIGIIDLLVMLFYFRDAYWEAIYQFTDHSYLWGAIAIGAVYGLLGTILGISSIAQLRDMRKFSYLGNISLIIAVFSMVAAIMGGILQQVAEFELGLDLWFYPNNLVLGAIALVPILIFLLSQPVSDRFRKLLEVKEDEHGRIIRLRKRSQAISVSVGLVFLIVIGLLSIGLFDHDKWKETYELNDLIDTIEVRPGVRIEIWNTEGFYNAYYIVYEDDGTIINSTFIPELMGSLEWLVNNSLSGEKVFCWWDYGASIEGYTDLESVIDKPAKYIQQTIYDPSSVKEWSNDTTTIEDVAVGLIAQEPSLTISMMEKYNATYLLTDIRDYGILYAMVLGAKEETDDYIEWDDDSLTQKGQSTTINRIWSGEDIPGLEVVYSDLEVKVLKRT